MNEKKEKFSNQNESQEILNKLENCREMLQRFCEEDLHDMNITEAKQVIELFIKLL